MAEIEKKIKYENKQIDIFLNDGDIYDNFSNPNNPFLKEDIYAYIEKEAKKIPIRYPLELNIYSDFFTEKDAQLIKNNYIEKMFVIARKKKRNRFYSLLLLITGIILYLIYFGSVYIWDNVVFKEIFSITATFIIWESIDFAIIQGNAIRFEYLFYTRLAFENILIIKNEDKIKRD